MKYLEKGIPEIVWATVQKDSWAGTKKAFDKADKKIQFFYF